MAFKLHPSMQKCVIFLLFLYSISLKAQTVKIKEVDFSIWIEELQTTQHQAEASLLLEMKQVTDRLNFDFSEANAVTQIHIVEGRDKESLGFDHSKNRLEVKLDKEYNAGELLRLRFRYKLGLSNNRVINAYDSTSNLLALNSSVFLSGGQDLSSHFFPSLRDQKALFKINITFPDGMSSMTPGKLNFITLNGNSRSHYWSTTEPLSLEKFYIRVGDFEDHEIEEPEDDPIADLIDPRIFRRTALKESLAGSMDFYRQQVVFSVSDSLIDLIDERTENTGLNFYLDHADIERSISAKTFKQEQIAALLISGNDTIKASWLNLEWNIREHGTGWLNDILIKKWPTQAGDSVSKTDAQVRMYYYEKELKDTLKALHQHLPDSIFEKFSSRIINQGKLPRVKINYRYISSKKGLLLFTEQDTNLAAPYSFPLLLRIYLKDTLINTALTIKAVANDTLIAFIPESPQAGEIYAGLDFPGIVAEKKPETYHLYMLSKGSSPQKREVALLELFETKNKNLLSTVLGIAMDSPDAAIRLKALAKADNLDEAAQNKLKETLIKLARQDPDGKVRQKAFELIGKYYPDK